MFDKDVDLPTLEQVLHRETLPPVCLYNFYIVMRDRLKMEKALDFYLDIQHHEQLWKCYAKSMQKQQQQQNSVENDLGEGLYPLHHNSFYTATVPPSPPLTTSTTLTAASPTISRKDIVDSAQSLLLTYIIPSAPKEMTHLLPNQLILELRKELEKTLRRGDDGSLLLLLLGDVKAYLLGLMQKYAYPKFLQLKVWGNITLYQQLGRLVLGLLSLLAAFTLALSLILLGYPQWTTHRFFTVIPFWVGFLNVLVFLTGLDPIWVLLLNKSETTTFKFNSIQQSQVKRMLVSRSIWLLLVSIVLAVLFMVIFCVLPSQ